VRLRNEDMDYPGYGKGVDIWALGVCLYILLSGVHPYQVPDEEEMLDNIESGVWSWKGNNWTNVSEAARTLIMNMMCPDASARWDAEKCLESKWITGHAPDEEMAEIHLSIKQYQAKKKLKGAILGVMATNNLVRMTNAMTKPRDPAAPKPEPKPVVKAEETPSPKGTGVNWESLKIRVIKGSDLAARNTNGKSDPYLKFWCGQYKYKSKKKTNTLAPEWNETIKAIPSSICANKDIEVECWDWDLIGSDNFMGQFVIEPSALAKLTVDQAVTLTFPLEPKKKTAKKKSDKVTGTITLEITKL